MGGKNTKESFIRAITDLSDAQNVPSQEDSHWNRFWDDASLTYDDFFTLIKPEDIRKIRDDAAGNLTALCFKLVERLTKATQTACTGPNEHASVLNCVRLLTRVIPFLFEDAQWRMIFWSPANMSSAGSQSTRLALGQMLLNAIGDLLFCPDFTVVGKQAKKGQPSKQEDLSHIDSCEHLWEAGIACTKSPGSTTIMDNNRSELLTLLSVCFSESLYYSQEEERPDNQWLLHFTSMGNRHVLPLLTSFLNIVCAYDPVGYGVPYAYALYSDARERLVTCALQVLVVVLDYKPEPKADPSQAERSPQMPPVKTTQAVHEAAMQNLFYSYIVRLHQKDDLEFLVTGLTNLLSNPLTRTYLPSSRKKIGCVEELLVLTWKLMEANKKFLNHILQSQKLFDLVVPILYYILDAKASASKVGQLHVGIFTVLLMSGERNFGVRLNKPFMQKLHPDISHFTGSHADLLYLTVHKIITSGLPRLQPLYDSLLTILVNVSPYLKTLSMVTCARLLHLMESFSTPWFLYAKPTNHYLVFYLLETFNNIIQYQFDGNTNLVYCVIRSRSVFHQLTNLTVVEGKPNEQSSSSVESPKEPKEEEEERIPSPAPQENVAEDPTQSSRQVVEVEIHPQGKENTEEVNGGGEVKDSVDRDSEGEQPDIGPREPQTIPDLPAHQVPLETVEVRTESVPTTHESKSKEFPVPQDNTKPPPKDPVCVDPLRKLDQGKKKGSMMDLFPLRQGVASNTAKLVEPHTPSDFKPTPEWLAVWKEKLPLQTISRLLQVLVPQVEKLCVENNVTTEKEVLEYLKNGTLVGLLPIPHPILIRKYQTNITTMKWFHTYIWGLLFVKNYDLGVWTSTEIKLFQLVSA